MRKLFTYLVRIALLAGIFLGLSRLTQSGDRDILSQEYTDLYDTGEFLEQNALSYYMDLPDHMVVPENIAVTAGSNEHPISKTIKYFPQRRYLMQKTFRDYLADYRIVMHNQEELPPILPPSLKYVFMLRQIVI